jgi:hypothetical protein
MTADPDSQAIGPRSSEPCGPACNRRGDVVVVAPTTAFLDEDEARWIVFVNLQSFWDRDHQEDFTRATGHIHDLLNRYLDAVPQEPDVRLETFTLIANEINEAMGGLNQVIVPNTMYEPGSDWNDISDRISTKPFLFGNLEGVAGAYASLARFLTCRHVNRLKRCRSCNGLYISPTEGDDDACPNPP